MINPGALINGENNTVVLYAAIICIPGRRPIIKLRASPTTKTFSIEFIEFK